MITKQTNSQSEDVKEVTLYNFTTIRNAENLNQEARKKNINYIVYDENELSETSESTVSDTIELKVDLDFLDFDKLRQVSKEKQRKTEKYEGEELRLISEDDETEGDTIQLRLNIFYERILNFYNSKTDNFLAINNLLLGIDFENNLKVTLEREKSFIRKIWLSFVYNIKYKNDFKEKEIATNLLRYFHLKNHRNLIDDEKREERWNNLSKLMNAQIIIPEELFPKGETFFYGKKDKIQKQYKPDEYFVKEHDIKIIKLKKDTIGDEHNKTEFDTTIEAQNEELAFLRKKHKKTHPFFKNIGRLSYLPYVASIEQIKSKCYFLVSIDFSGKDKNDFPIEHAILKINNKSYLFPKLPEDEALKSSGFDIYLEIDDVITKMKPENINYDFEIQFKSGNFKSLKSQLLYKISDKSYNIVSCLVLDDGTDNYGKAFEPSGYGIQMLGIADYRKVVSTISRYIPAEVAKIENLMSGEFREKVTTQETSTEITEFESIETDNETQNETATNDRFQMQNEIANILNDQRSNNVTANAGYSNGGFYANLTTGNSATNSKEQSNKQSITQAKEITNKAVEKIVSKVKKERTIRVTEKFIDVNKYGFDNRGNKEHVSGVYRHINAVYRNRICNYGKRLTYEFSIPEPAFVHKKGIEKIEDDNLFEEIKEIPIPTNPNDFIKSYSDLNEKNYEAFIKFFEIKDFKKYPKYHYQLPVNNPPHPAEFSEKISVEIKPGFTPISYTIKSKQNIEVGYGPGKRMGTFKVSLDDKLIYQFSKRLNGNYPHWEKDYIDDFGDIKISYNQNIIVCSLYGYFATSYNFILSIEFIPTTENILEWQKEGYEKIISAYNEAKNAYDDKVKDLIDIYKKKKIEEKRAIIDAAKNNPKSPAINRQIEINSLKRNCLSYLIDDSDEENTIRKFGTPLILGYDKSKIAEENFKNIKVELSPKLDEYTAFVRFLEQAFEWENMSYNFYPYFWGDKERWFENYNEDNDDPLHKAFLQAGMARVIVTVRPGFEDAVKLYMITGKIWLGGNLPVYGSSLFVSIAEELRNGNEEYFIEGEWESVLPTNLIAIQSSGVSIKQEGLPNLDEYGGLGKVDDRKATPKRRKFLGLF